MPTTRDSALALAATLLAPWAGEQNTPEPGRLDIVLEASALPAVAARLQEARWGYLAAITGLDQGPEVGAIEVLYHFCAGPAILTLRVRVPRAEPSVPSLCGEIPSASVLERELAEMFGVVVTGAPDSRRLYIADDWPARAYPLRKDFVTTDEDTRTD
jgi:Ni,Fe-hydrogenase III component G